MEQYDDDYVYGEYNKGNNDVNDNNEIINISYRKLLTYKKRRHIKSITTTRIKNYIQYYMLYRYVTNPIQWSDHSFRKTRIEYNNFILQLRTDINEIFYLDKHPKLEDFEYLRTNIQNKRHFITLSIKKILDEYPEIYDDNAKIIEYVSKKSFSLGKMLYSTSYYDKSVELYKKMYGNGNMYPVKEAMYELYFPFINFIKKKIS